MKYNLIVAKTLKNVIGNNNKLPWKIPSEMRYFKDITMGSNVIMGRKTYESIGKPLQHRHNIVISSKDINNVTTIRSYEEALDRCNGDTFIIGGASVYKQAMKDPNCTTLYVSDIIHPDYNGDVKFPKIGDRFKLISERVSTEDNHVISYKIYKRHDEYQYLNLISRVLEEGDLKRNTLSVIGNVMKFDLSKFPLLTTKKMFFKGVLKELLWFIRGCTSSKELSKEGVKIWDKNGSKEYLKFRNIDREEGDLGPVYGFQWRHFGAQYRTCHDKYDGEGVDQLKRIINEIKSNPDSRQIIMSAWNPGDIDQMALPPCHVLSRFHVLNGKLSCSLYQRSCDVGLGVPFNIASYSLLTYMIAMVCGLEAGELVYFMDDCHIYLEHVDKIKEQVDRNPYEFPVMKINHRDDIDDFVFEDFKLEGYKHHDGISMNMII